MSWPPLRPDGMAKTAEEVFYPLSGRRKWRAAVPTMTNFAPVAPLPILQQLAEADALGTYQLLIAPIVLGRETEYRKFFQEHDDNFVIVDNGVIELGYALSAFDLWRAAKIVGASLVVLPDTVDDAKMTIKQVRHSLDEYRKLDKSTDTMGVVQGLNFEECMSCATKLVEAGVDWLGVPRGLTPNLGTRVRLVKYLGAEFQLPMHVLGFSENVVDDIMAATAHPLVRGMDAATPVWLGFMDQPRIDTTGLEEPTGRPGETRSTVAGRPGAWARMLPWAPPLYANFGSRPKHYWEAERVEHIDPIVFNLDRVRGWLGDPQTALTESNGAPVVRT